MTKEAKRVEVKCRSEWRAWLKANHEQSESIWLVTYKATQPEFYLPYADIVEEALCFGWIDSLPRALDEKRTMLRLSPRSPKSAWSKINRDRVASLIKRKLMTDAGLAIISAAKKNGTWGKLKPVDNNKVPVDLMVAFGKFSGSQKNFAQFPPSSKRAILEWILQAKAPATRSKRITETARLAAKGIRANHYRQPKKQK